LDNQLARYRRNFKTLTMEEQNKLMSSTAAVVGCGGLGGYIAEQLARLGIGNLILIDGDTIEESNLNRQLFALEGNIGRLKVEAAKDRLKAVNSTVNIKVHAEWLGPETGRDMLKGADIVFDALDSGKTRVELERVCYDLGIPLVLAAIGGWYGVLGVSYPGDFVAQNFFGKVDKGIESELGNPAFSPAVVASLSVAEGLKVICGREPALRKQLLYIDMLAMEFNKFSL